METRLSGNKSCSFSVDRLLPIILEIQKVKKKLKTTATIKTYNMYKCTKLHFQNDHFSLFSVRSQNKLSLTILIVPFSLSVYLLVLLSNNGSFFDLFMYIKPFKPTGPTGLPFFTILV